MSIESRSRVQKGVATGGQFATENKSEDGSVSLSAGAAGRPFTNPNDLPLAPIRLQLQRWNEQNNAETVEEIMVDGRTLFAGMSREDMQFHMDFPLNGAEDEMLEQAERDGLVKKWDGPFNFEVGPALNDLQHQDPAILDTFSEARLDPTTYYSVGEDGRLQSAEESLDEDLDRQYASYRKVEEDLAYLQLRPFVQDVEQHYPDIASVTFAQDGDEDDPLFVSSITLKSGTVETFDDGAFLENADYPQFSPGNAIRTDRSYSFNEIRNFRPKR